MITIRKAAAILFLEGLASSGLQMITIRQTVPFVGNSVLTTSIVIACFLAALALGYYHGGKQTSGKYAHKLLYNLVISIGIFGVGLSYLFVEFFFLSISNLTVNIQALHSPLVHLFAFCILVMSPLVFCLAQTVPLLLNVSKAESTKSEAAGNATALSTIGNVIGCLFTALILLVYLGVGTAIFINCLILAVCLFFLPKPRLKKSVPIPYLFVVVLLGTSHLLNVRINDDMFDTTTAHSNFNIEPHEDGHRMMINRSFASFIGAESRKGWPYAELIKKSFEADAAIKNKDILVLGAGGFTLSAETDFGANFTYVDIDDKIKTIAEDLFLTEKIKGKFVAEDARRFLLEDSKKWDYIVIDLYSNSATIPMHTATLEFFDLVQKRLKPSGISILNIAANPYMNDDYSRNMDHTLRAAFSGCITDITDYRDTLVNIVYYCKPSNIQNFASVYRDNTTKVAVDGFNTFFSDSWSGY